MGSYVVLSAVLFLSVLRHLNTVLIGKDGELYAWWLRGIPTALAHGHDPLLIGTVLHPGPANAMWNTSIVLPSIVMAPVTFLIGPIASVNLLLFFSPIVSAGAAWWMCREFGAGRGAAWIGGLLYGFGPFEVAESFSHIHMSLGWFPPVAAVLLRRILITQSGSPVRTGTALGLAATAQLLCGEEILGSSVLVAGIAVAILAIRYHGSIRDKAPYAFRALGSAVVVGGVLSVAPLAVQFGGPNRVSGSIWPINQAYNTDLATFIAPTKVARFDLLGLSHLASNTTTDLAENLGYLGLPLVIVVITIIVLRRADPVVRFSAIMAVLTAILSLGAHIEINGRDTGIPTPTYLLLRLPLFKSSEPSRLSGFVILFLALLLAKGLTGLVTTNRARLVLGVALVVTAVSLWPSTTFDPLTRPLQPAFFTGNLVSLIPPDAPVLIGPPPGPDTPEGMLWQVDAGMRFKLTTAYIAPWYLDYPNDAADRALLYVELGWSLPSSLNAVSIRTDLATSSIGAVVLGPEMKHLGEAEQVFTRAIGRPPLETGGVLVWILSGPYGYPPTPFS